MIKVVRNVSAAPWAHGSRSSSGRRLPGDGRAIAAVTLAAAALLLGGLLLQPGAEPGGPAPGTASPSQLAHRQTMPAFFERNVGQAADGIRFIGRTADSSVALTGTSAIVATKAGRLTMRLRGAAAHPRMRATGVLPGRVNYLHGNDRAAWHTDVPTSSGVRAGAVYPGIDLIWRGSGGRLEYDFVVAPGADPGRIAIDVEGARRLARAANGDLLITMPDGSLRRDEAPTIFQTIGARRVAVAGRYELSGHVVRFRVGAYDRTRTLTIDPLLYATLTGGSTSRAVAVDADGNAYVVGGANSTSVFASKPGAFQSSSRGSNEGWVAKIDPSRSGAASIVYATFLGGAGNEIPAGVAVDGAGHAYLTGETSSQDYPVTPNAFQPAHSAGNNVDSFLTKLTADGSALMYSSYVGGSNDEGMGGETQGLALAAGGVAYVTGRTSSTNFPVVAPLQATNGGSYDAWVTKFDTTKSGAASVAFSTYLGGAADDAGISIAVDAAGDMFVGGGTASTNFPGASSSPIQASNRGGQRDGFVTELSASGQQQLWSTYLGGTSLEQVTALTIDGAGNAYAYGNTFSTNFPTTPGALKTTASSDVFVTKIAAGGGSLAYSTYLGGSSPESMVGSQSIKVDAAGNAWVGGQTQSANFPMVNPVQGTFAGAIVNAFVAELNPAGSALVFSTFLGGAGVTGVEGLALTDSGSVYLSGNANSNQNATPRFPATVNGARPTSPTNSDTYLAVLSPPGQQADVSISAAADPEPVVAGTPLTYTLTVSNAGPGAAGNVVVTDTLPAGVTFGSAQADPTGTCAAPAGSTLTCGVVSLLPGKSTTITFDVTPTGAGTITNSATVAADTGDPVTANDSASVDATVTAPTSADLSVTKTASTPSVVLGLPVTYTVTVANAGPTAAAHIAVTDTLPANVTFKSAQATRGTCPAPSGATLTCSITSLLSGQSSTITVKVTPTAVGTITNAVAVSAETPDPEPGNNAASADVEVTPPVGAGLSITKTASPTQGVAGNQLRYTLHVVNAGPDTAFATTLSDPLPAGVTFGAASASQGTCSGTATVTCALGTMASGSDATVTIDVTPTAAGSVTNSASVSSDTPDSDPSDNSASVTTNVIQATADLSLTHTDAPDPVISGDRLTYTLTVSNAGPSPASGTSLVDQLPAGTTLVSATPTQGSCSGTTTVTCSLGTIASGAGATVTVAVSAPATTGTIAASATVTANEFEPTPATNSAAQWTTVNPAPIDFLPRVVVNATTTPLSNGVHTSSPISARCPTGALVGGGAYLRNAALPATLPTNGLVLGGSAASTGAAPLDQFVADGAIDPTRWLALGNFTGASETGDQGASFALCATGGYAHTVVKTATTVGVNAAQQADPPNLTTATCAPGTRLIGGGAVTSTPDQINDGTTFGNAGNLKPLASYPSNAAGAGAADGSTAATSWTAYGSAGIPSAVDTVIAYALCATDGSPAVRVTRVDVASTQTASAVTTATPSCPAGTRLIGGGYQVDQTVGALSGLQPQQGYHMRGSYPSSGSASPPAEVADGTSNPTAWTSVLQAGGQVLGGTSHMDLHAYAMCATPPPPPAPTVVTGAPGAITSGGANVVGTVNPNSIATTYVFEYGTTPLLGSVTPTAGAGSATSAGTVGATLSGLTPATTVFYRLVATSASGTTIGSTLSFVTAVAVATTAAEPSIQTNGSVLAMASTADRVFLGGSMTRAGVPTGRGADLSRADGTPNLAFAKPNGNVGAVVADGAGGWYVGGAFTQVGATARNGLAHLLADGSVDPAFNPNVSGGVNALVLSGATLYAGGGFTAVNGGTSRNRVAAFDAATGAVTGFNPGVGGTVFALALSGSTLYVGGQFTTVGSPAVTRNRIAAFDTATSLPTSFDPNMTGGGMASVQALALSGTTLYAGGNFTGANGGAAARASLAALDTTTGLATSFNAGVNGAVVAIAVSGTTVYASGGFTTVNAGTAARSNVAAFDGSSGAVVAGFDPNASGGQPRALALAGGVLYVGGDFTAVGGGAVPRSRMAAYTVADGLLVTGFDPNVESTVSALAVAGTRVYAGGAFNFVGANTVVNRIVSLKPDGTVDQAFTPNVTNGNVNALAVSGSRLYACGSFTTVNGTLTRNNLAALDTATGTADAGFNPNLSGQCNALAVAGTTLYAGGAFTTVNGSTARNRIAALSTTTGTATAFDPNVGGSVSALALAGTTLYAGGAFTTVNGSTARNRAAAFDTTTATATAFDPNANNLVSALALSGGTLYLGGTFTTVGGATTDRLAAVDRTTGARNASFDPKVAGQVSALALSGTTLYAGGGFTTVNCGVARTALAGFDASSGVVAPQFNPSPSSGATISALLASGPRLYAGGTFTSIGPSFQLQFAQFAIPAPPAAPSATTGAASAITTTGASLGGSVDPNQRLTQFVFEYGPTQAFGAITAPDDAGLGDGDVPVTATLAGLSPNTTYYYRLVATNSLGSAVGVVRRFRTSGSGQPPVAITGAASAVTNTGAMLAGQVNPKGQQTAYTIEYGTDTSFGSITPVVALDDADALEPVSATLTGLAADTTFYFRVVASNATGTTFGSVGVFSTGPGGAPIVATGSAGSITSTSATLNGTVDAHGSPTAYTFEYGPTNAFGLISAVDSAGSTNGANPYSLPIGGLSPGTQYRFRIVATNANGTTTGAVGSFVTASGA